MNFKETAKKFIPTPLLLLYHFLWAFFGAALSGFPGESKKMKIIGVTGTSGKSTTVDFISRILEEAGYKVASISSIRFKVGKEERQNKYKMTMPGRFVIQKFLKEALSAKCDFAVLEVTSEGIRQSRHKFIHFDAAVFTNLSKEHIESHGSFENYRNEKLKLFKATKNIHVINAEDPNTKYFLDIPAKQKITFSSKELPFTLNVEGVFNQANAAAAIVVARVYGVSIDVAKAALQRIHTIPGRMEIVNEQPKIVVDYAHTPDQLELVYKSMKNSGGKLICVLGSCGGGRDTWKRPVLGQIAGQYCDRIFLTNEDPYDEDALSIIKEVAAGMKNSAKTEEILDRQEAIEKAIALAAPEDVVIITGKGSEPWMCLANGKKIPWDDRKIAREALVEKGID